MMPRISVIIPTKNRAHYLGGALSSVLNQSFGDLEVLVIDDASEDNTEEVVRSFRDPRIRYMRHSESRGGSAARNTGIRNAVGLLIGFLDDDDEWLQQKLKLQVKLLDAASDRIGCIYTGFELFDSDRNERVGVWTPRHRGDLREKLLEGNVVSTTSTVLLRKSYLDRAGLFDEELPSMQDYDLWLRLAQFCQFEYIEQPLVRYRLHETRISTSLVAPEQGLRKLLKKHGSPGPLKRTCSRLLLNVAVAHANSGRMRDAQRVLALTIRLNPIDPVCYFYLSSALLGKKGYKGVQRLKQKILTAIRNHNGRKQLKSSCQ
jgi:glycosyltransferase involved in cell wall biosynthesis